MVPVSLEQVLGRGGREASVGEKGVRNPRPPEIVRFHGLM